MTWAALTVTAAMVKGVATPDFLDEDGDFDATLILSDVVAAAKSLVRTKVTKKLGPFVMQKGGPNAFFDAVADLTDSGDDLEVLVNEMLAYAFLHQWSFSEHPARLSRLLEDSEYYMQRLDEAVGAFCAVAPALILTDAEKKFGKTGSVVVTSSPNYYGYDG